jgi:phage portal protein BeeE
MGNLSALFHSRDKPQNRTAGSAYTFFMGGSTAGKAVNERSAMQMTAVYSCVRILSEAIAGLPLHLYIYTEDGNKVKAVEHPLYHRKSGLAGRTRRRSESKRIRTTSLV